MRFITTLLLFVLLVDASAAAAFVVAILAVISGLTVCALVANEVVADLFKRIKK